MQSTESNKSTYTLVDFWWSDNHLGIVDSHSGYLIGGLEYLPEPSMEVKIPPTTGGLKDKPASIQVASNGQQFAVSEFLFNVSGTNAWPPTRVRVREYAVGEGSERSEMTHLFRGLLNKGIRNAEGVPNIVRIEALWPKNQATVSLGITANAECDFLYGGEGCGLDVTQPYSGGTNPTASEWHTMQITAIQGPAVLAVPSSGDPGEQAVIVGAMDRFSGGYFLKDGLRLRVKEHRLLTNWFILDRQPPPDWTSTTSELHPGCVKTPTACRERFASDNTRFGGFGWGIPAYNPAIEVEV